MQQQEHSAAKLASESNRKAKQLHDRDQKLTRDEAVLKEQQEQLFRAYDELHDKINMF